MVFSFVGSTIKKHWLQKTALHCFLKPMFSFTGRLLSGVTDDFQGGILAVVEFGNQLGLAHPILAAHLVGDGYFKLGCTTGQPVDMFRDLNRFLQENRDLGFEGNIGNGMRQAHNYR